MFRRTLVVASILTACAFAPAAFAQQEEGDSELIFNGQFFKTVGGNGGFGALQLNAVYGYFYTEQSEILGGVVGTVAFGGGFTNATLGLLGGYRYNWKTSNPLLVPYVGGGVYIVDLSPDPLSVVDVTFANGQVGAKYFLNRNVAFDLNGSVGFALGDLGTANISARFGLSYIFSRRTP